MASSNDNVSMALFCDFENVALGVRDANYDKFDIKPVLERLLLKGSIVVKKAYCDWDRYKAFKAPMHEANFELIEIPHVRQSGKNSADIRMVVDALDLCYTKSHVDTFVIISGDSDFSPLVSKLRENAKKVIGVGVKQSTSDLLVANCDEFIFYDDLVRESRRAAAKRDPRDAQPAVKRTPEEETRRREEMDKRRSQAVEIAVGTFDALVSERGDSGKIWASVLKEAIKRRKPDFSESYYGFRTFGNLLEEAKARGLLEFGRDEKSGAYVYRSSGAAAVNADGSAVVSDNGAAPEAGEGRPEGKGEMRRGRGRGRDRDRSERNAERANVSAERSDGFTDADTDNADTVELPQDEADVLESGAVVEAIVESQAAQQQQQPSAQPGGQQERGRGRGNRGGRKGERSAERAPERAPERAVERTPDLDLTRYPDDEYVISDEEAAAIAHALTVQQQTEGRHARAGGRGGRNQAAQQPRKDNQQARKDNQQPRKDNQQPRKDAQQKPRNGAQQQNQQPRKDKQQGQQKGGNGRRQDANETVQASAQIDSAALYSLPVAPAVVQSAPVELTPVVVAPVANHAAEAAVAKPARAPRKPAAAKVAKEAKAAVEVANVAQATEATEAKPAAGKAKAPAKAKAEPKAKAAPKAKAEAKAKAAPKAKVAAEKVAEAPAAAAAADGAAKPARKPAARKPAAKKAADAAE